MCRVPRQEGSRVIISGQVMDLASNKEKRFLHGWFVVRNRTPLEAEEDIEGSERLEREQSFFENRPWNELPGDRRGTQALKKYLAELLCARIEKAFPALLQDITALRNKTMSELEAMSTSRTTIEQKRSYLTGIAQDFKDRASQSLQGRYDSTTTNETKLRMKVCEANDAFALDLRMNGHSVPFIAQIADEGKRVGPYSAFNSTTSVKPVIPQASKSDGLLFATPENHKVRSPCPGTAAVPFQFHPHVIKEWPTEPKTMSHMQSITFKTPFTKYSFEELRLSDYVQTPSTSSTHKPASSLFAPSQQSSKATGFGSLPGQLQPASSGVFFDNGPGLSAQMAPQTVDQGFLTNVAPANQASIEMYQWIRDEIKANRGTELKGTLNPDVLPSLFHKQARKWKQISEGHFLKIRTLAVHALIQMSKSVCADPLTQRLIEDLIKAANQQGKKGGLIRLSDHVNNILSKHLQTNNPAFEQKVDEARRMRFHAAIERYRSSRGSQPKPLSTNGASVESDGRDYDNQFLVIDMRDTAALFAELHISNSQNLEDEVHDTLRAYYEIAREDFIEYVNQHIVEPYLDDFQGPVLFFSPLYVAGLDNERIEALAAEDERLVRDRESNRETLARLSRAKVIAERYSR